MSLQKQILMGVEHSQRDRFLSSAKSERINFAFQEFCRIVVTFSEIPPLETVWDGGGGEFPHSSTQLCFMQAIDSSQISQTTGSNAMTNLLLCSSVFCAIRSNVIPKKKKLSIYSTTNCASPNGSVPSPVAHRSAPPSVTGFCHSPSDVNTPARSGALTSVAVWTSSSELDPEMSLGCGARLRSAMMMAQISAIAATTPAIAPPMSDVLTCFDAGS